MSFLKVYSNEIQTSSQHILKVGHHGSRFSSSLDFLKAIHPEAAWISVGAHNRYHHPHPDTLVRLQSLGIPVQRTDVEGDLSEGSEGGELPEGRFH